MPRTLTFFPAPSVAAAIIPATVYGAWKFGDDHRALKREVADHLQCDEADLTIADEVWDQGERFADFVYLNGRIIGSVDEKLTPSEWKYFYETHIPYYSPHSPEPAPRSFSDDFDAIFGDC